MKLPLSIQHTARKTPFIPLAVVRHFIDVLNRVLRTDEPAIRELINHRVPCSSTLAEHPTVQVGPDTSGQPVVGMLGLINGLCGADPETGYGPISVDFRRGRIVTFSISPAAERIYTQDRRTGRTTSMLLNAVFYAMETGEPCTILTESRDLATWTLDRLVRVLSRLGISHTVLRGNKKVTVTATDGKDVEILIRSKGMNLDGMPPQQFIDHWAQGED